MKKNNEMNKNIILSINNLKVEYRTLEDTTYAVNGVNLLVEKGSAVAIVGETGAGKTTTALSILRLLPRAGVVTSGSIYFNNNNLLNLSKHEIEQIRGNQISMIFQDPMASLNPIFKIIEQITEVIITHNKVSPKEAEERAIEMLKSVGISSDRANDYPHEFSGGMTQRVMIAIALACQPKIIIADEPTTALDVTIQVQVLTLMNELKKKFKTSMIFITHDLGIVPMVCDKVNVMYAGQIIESGTIHEVYNKPLHPYTKGLFECTPDFDEPKKDIKPISGLSPDLKNEITGCAFYPRCPEKSEKCKNNFPRPIFVNENHQVTCFNYLVDMDKADCINNSNGMLRNSI